MVMEWLNYICELEFGSFSKLSPHHPDLSMLSKGCGFFICVCVILGIEPGPTQARQALNHWAASTALLPHSQTRTDNVTSWHVTRVHIYGNQWYIQFVCARCNVHQIGAIGIQRWPCLHMGSTERPICFWNEQLLSIIVCLRHYALLKSSLQIQWKIDECHLKMTFEGCPSVGRMLAEYALSPEFPPSAALNPPWCDGTCLYRIPAFRTGGRTNPGSRHF